MTATKMERHSRKSSGKVAADLSLSTSKARLRSSERKSFSTIGSDMYDGEPLITHCSRSRREHVMHPP
jgi:hypothetical protein